VTLRLPDFLKEVQDNIQATLQHYIKETEGPPQLLEAMEYSLMAGGKRIRPAFLMATIEALEGENESLEAEKESLEAEKVNGLAAACAIEMIHTYSLIHDDLPAMDDDDYRRGKLTNHKVFGEAMAILAGDALLTHAFYILTHEQQAHLSAEIRLEMVKELSLLAGAKGMVGGQVADILGEEKALQLTDLYYIHEHKTADLLTCSVRLGCYIAGAGNQQLEDLTTYAKHIGIAFQIQDDILDEIGDEVKLGKKVGSDRQNEKTTFVSLLGLEGAKKELDQHIQLSKQALKQANVKESLLLELTDYMVQREN
jgi:geranylgeranyl diphosphate synthase type II